MLGHSAQPRQRQSRHHARRGAAAVEMALVLPLLLLLALATADFGRVVHAYLAVSNATRCGAECGSLHQFTDYTRAAWEARVRQAIEDEMQGLSGFLADDLETDLTTTVDADGLFQVSVEVTYPFTTVVDWPGVPRQVDLYHQVVSRQTR